MLILSEKNGTLSPLEWSYVLGVLRGGGVVAYPTDTAYGLAVDPRVRGATKKIFAIKGRRDDKPLSVIVSSTVMAKKFAVFSQTANAMARKHWPGALMLVVPIKKTIEARPLASLGSRTSVGLRFPDYALAKTMVQKMAYPVTSTSANRSGKSACYSLDEFLLQFKNASVLPDLFIDTGALPKRPTSTVIDCTGHRIKILRQGGIYV